MIIVALGAIGLSWAESAVIAHAPESLAADNFALAAELTPSLLEDLRHMLAEGQNATLDAAR